MEKNLLNDVEVPAHKRSIRDIPIPQNRMQKTEHIENHFDEPNSINLKKIKSETSASSNISPSYKNAYVSQNKSSATGSDFFSPEHIQKSKSRVGLISSISFVFLLLVIFGVMNFFHSAEITLYPKNAQAEINHDISIVNFDDKKTGGELTYKIYEFKDEVSESVVASGEEYVSEKASGTITIYNKFTSKAQGLIKNTRFEAPNGKIYRIQETISVPGYKTVNGEIVPGSIEAVVYADEPGTGYENGIVDFKIPGFKGQPQYDSFYAKSKTNITGGFVGTRKIISKEQLTTAQNSITEKLKSKLQNNLNEQLPNNLIVINSGESAFLFEDLKREEKDKDNIILKLKGTLSVKVADKGKLSEKIAESSIGGTYVIGSPILVTNLSEIAMSLTSTSSLAVKGNAKFVWQLNSEDLKQKIAGKNKTDIITTLSDFSGIDRVELKVSPFWKKVFPEKTERIDVIQVLPN